MERFSHRGWYSSPDCDTCYNWPKKFSCYISVATSRVEIINMDKQYWCCMLNKKWPYFVLWTYCIKNNFFLFYSVQFLEEASEKVTRVMAAYHVFFLCYLTKFIKCRYSLHQIIWGEDKVTPVPSTIQSRCARELDVSVSVWVGWTRKTTSAPRPSQFISHYHTLFHTVIW